VEGKNQILDHFLACVTSHLEERKDRIYIYYVFYLSDKSQNICIKETELTSRPVGWAYMLLAFFFVTDNLTYHPTCHSEKCIASGKKKFHYSP